MHKQCMSAFNIFDWDRGHHCVDRRAGCTVRNLVRKLSVEWWLHIYVEMQRLNHCAWREFGAITGYKMMKMVNEV